MTSRKQIEARVFPLLRRKASKDVSGVPNAQMASLYMARDLGLARPARRSLAADYTTISRAFGGRVVPPSHAERRIKIKTVIDLVLERANA